MNNPFGFYRDAVLVGQVPDGERLDPFGALHVGFGAQRPTQLGAPSVSQGGGAGDRGPARPVRGRAEHMIEHQRAHTAVHIARRPFVGRAQNEFRPHQPVGLVMDDQRRRHRVTQTHHGIAPRDGLTVEGAVHTERPGQ